MNEKRTFKKRLTGLLAMSLVLAMMMGMTVNAASAYYYSNSDLENGDSSPNPYRLCTNSGCTELVSPSKLIEGGDTIYYVGNNCGSLEIKIDGVTEVELDSIISSHTINGTDSYTYSLGSGILELTTVTNDSQDIEEKLCSHGGKYSKVIKEPTETEDGIIGWFCEKCDEKLYEEYMSSYAYFLKSTIEKINKAEAGSTVEISSKVWNSLSQDVMLAMAARRDINVVMTLRYQHEDYRYNIPAGTAIDTVDKYYGPMYLGQLYGMTKLEK